MNNTVTEGTVSAISNPPIYDDLLDVLSESTDAQRMLAFRLSPARQARLDDLLERNRQGRLSEEESMELDEFEHIEHLVRLLKARLLRKKAP
jgi:hypothetical protein